MEEDELRECISAIQVRWLAVAVREGASYTLLAVGCDKLRRRRCRCLTLHRMRRCGSVQSKQRSFVTTSKQRSQNY